MSNYRKVDGLVNRIMNLESPHYTIGVLQAEFGIALSELPEEKAEKLLKQFEVLVTLWEQEKGTESFVKQFHEIHREQAQ